MADQLRHFNDSSPITRCFDYPTSPLIKIAKNGDVSYYNSKNEKINALKDRVKTDKFIMVWPGQWKSDTFIVSNEDINLILSR
jgi:hypothetical protein